MWVEMLHGHLIIDWDLLILKSGQIQLVGITGDKTACWGKKGTLYLLMY